MINDQGQKAEKITVSDPSGKACRIYLTVSGRIENEVHNFLTTWNENEQSNKTTVELPDAGYSGNGATMDL